MNKFRKGDTVKFSNDFFNIPTDIIVRDTYVPRSVIELIKTYYFEQPFRVTDKFINNDSVKIDTRFKGEHSIDNSSGVDINGWWWKPKWLDFFECQEIHIDQKEVIKLI